MSMHREWHADAKKRLTTYARQGRSETKQAGQAWELVRQAANGRWNEYEVVPPALSQGRSLRFFEVGHLTVVLQVLDPVKIRVLAVGVAPVDIADLVNAAINVL